jgi:mRNA interferase RelE/StbE
VHPHPPDPPGSPDPPAGIGEPLPWRDASRVLWHLGQRRGGNRVIVASMVSRRAGLAVAQSAHPAAVEFITGPLLEAPHRVGRPLRGALSGFHSARIGTQWRVLYRIDESKHAVIVQDIQHRSTAYRRR